MPISSGPGSVNYNNIRYSISILSILSSKTDIDDCASHPCKNNGTCTDRVNGFNCSCAPGFNGIQCETSKYSQNQLISIYIVGFKFLSKLFAVFLSLNLKHSFVVEFCCWSLQVLSNVTVINYLPYHLETDIDDCASHPCKNNGTCTDRVNGFDCSCAPGFNGTQCETGNYSRQNQLIFIYIERF